MPGSHRRVARFVYFINIDNTLVLSNRGCSKGKNAGRMPALAAQDAGGCADMGRSGAAPVHGLAVDDRAGGGC